VNQWNWLTAVSLATLQTDSQLSAYLNSDSLTLPSQCGSINFVFNTLHSEGQLPVVL
jgi:hypothetical protein